MVIVKMLTPMKATISNAEEYWFIFPPCLIKCFFSPSISINRSPLTFGESNIKSRIKNIITYKKPAIGIIVAAIIVTTALIVAFTANPKNEQSPNPTIHSVYNIEALIANKTLYVGNNGKVVALIDAMSLPAGITRDKVELQTANQPYGITINLNMKDASLQIFPISCIYPHQVLTRLPPLILFFHQF